MSSTAASAFDRDQLPEINSYRKWVRQATQVCEEAARGNLEVRLLGCEAGDDVARLVNAYQSHARRDGRFCAGVGRGARRGRPPEILS